MRNKLLITEFQLLFYISVKYFIKQNVTQLGVKNPQ